MFTTVNYEDVSKLPGFPSVTDLDIDKPEYSPLKAYLALAFIAEKNLEADEVVYGVQVPFYPTEYTFSRALDTVYDIQAVGSENITVSLNDTEEVLMEKKYIEIAMFPIFAVVSGLRFTSSKPFALKYRASILKAECRYRCSKVPIEVNIDGKKYKAFQGELTLH